MENTFIKTDIDGNILAVFVGNDPDFEKNNEVINVTKDKNKKKILENSRHFKFKDKKISELSTTEKNKIDKELVTPPSPMWDALQKINDRLDEIEKNLKIKVKG